MYRFTLALAVIAAGCAVDSDTADLSLAAEQAPIPQLFDLDVDGTNGGNPITFSVIGAPPNTGVKLVRAVNGASVPGPCPPQLGGECLDIDGPAGVSVFGFTLTTDGNGDASRTLTLPAGVADGTPVSFQAVAPSFGAGSNTVDFVVWPGPAIPCTVDDLYEPNDDAINDVLSTPAASFTGLLCASASSDWYVIDLAVDDVLDIDVTFFHADGDIDLWVFDTPMANPVASTQNGSYLASSTSISDNEAVQVTATVDGPVYVRVYNWDNEWGGTTADSSYGFDYTITSVP